MTTQEALTLTLLAVALVVALARGAGLLARRCGQPAVVGEIVAGILLGPSALGALRLGGVELQDRLFPEPVRAQLLGLATIGMVLFMFLVGLELDMRSVRAGRRRAAVISGTSVVLPLGAGALLAVPLYAGAGTAAPPAAFCLFIGVAMAVTAFPVLARILTERGLDRRPLGALAIACAAVDDLLAWVLLAVAATLAGAAGGTAWLTAGGAAAFVAVTVLVVRPLAARLAARPLTPGALAAVLAGLLLSAWATDRIGLHAVFGAFAFGAALPRDAGLVAGLRGRLEDVSLTLLLPVFFVVTGLAVDLGAIDPATLGVLVAVVLVAVGAKAGGAWAAARLTGVPRDEAAVLAVLLNTRGLTELVVLNVGLAIGVLDTRLFTVFVVMAPVTTAMTAPLLGLLGPAGGRARAGDRPEHARRFPAEAAVPG